MTVRPISIRLVEPTARRRLQLVAVALVASAIVLAGLGGGLAVAASVGAVGALGLIGCKLALIGLAQGAHLSTDTGTHRQTTAALEARLSAIVERLDEQRVVIDVARVDTDRCLERMNSLELEMSRVADRLDAATIDAVSIEPALGRLAALQHDVARLRDTLSRSRHEM